MERRTASLYDQFFCDWVTKSKWTGLAFQPPMIRLTLFTDPNSRARHEALLCRLPASRGTALRENGSHYGCSNKIGVLFNVFVKKKSALFYICCVWKSNRSRTTAVDWIPDTQTTCLARLFHSLIWKHPERHHHSRWQGLMFQVPWPGELWGRE